MIERTNGNGNDMSEKTVGPRVGSSYPSFETCVGFHGGACIGLATGYRAATAAMSALRVSRPHDEELVCIAKTDACGVDAIQVVTGCIAGKGNLAVHDCGKHFFSSISRMSARAVRFRVRPDASPEPTEMDGLRKKVRSGAATPDEQSRYRALVRAAMERVLTLPRGDVVEFRGVLAEPSRVARIYASIDCARCGEPVADAKTRIVEGFRVCIPCAEEICRERGNRNA